jgi:hypothetical protein
MRAWRACSEASSDSPASRPSRVARGQRRSPSARATTTMPSSSATMIGRADRPNTGRDDNTPRLQLSAEKGRRAGYLTDGPEQEPEN